MTWTGGAGREHKRWMERQNMKMREKAKKEDPADTPAGGERVEEDPGCHSGREEKREKQRRKEESPRRGAGEEGSEEEKARKEERGGGRSGEEGRRRRKKLIRKRGARGAGAQGPWPPQEQRGGGGGRRCHPWRTLQPPSLSRTMTSRSSVCLLTWDTRARALSQIEAAGKTGGRAAQSCGSSCAPGRGQLGRGASVPGDPPGLPARPDATSAAPAVDGVANGPLVAAAKGSSGNPHPDRAAPWRTRGSPLGGSGSKSGKGGGIPGVQTEAVETRRRSEVLRRAMTKFPRRALSSAGRWWRGCLKTGRTRTRSCAASQDRAPPRTDDSHRLRGLSAGQAQPPGTPLVPPVYRWRCCWYASGVPTCPAEARRLHRLGLPAGQPRPLVHPGTPWCTAGVPLVCPWMPALVCPWCPWYALVCSSRSPQTPLP